MIALLSRPICVTASNRCVFQQSTIVRDGWQETRLSGVYVSSRVELCLLTVRVRILMILYFAEVQVVFAILVAWGCAFVLVLAWAYVSFEERLSRQAWMRTPLPDDHEEGDFLLRFSQAQLRTLANSQGNRFTEGLRVVGFDEQYRSR
jgi:hypothetical protein